MLNRDLPPFYVITVNYHSGLQLPGLIASLASLPLVKKLIIINHSPGETLPGLAAPFPVQVINQENRGYGGGLNRGLREIPEKNAVALLCNPDVALLYPERVAAALAFMEASPQVGCLIPRSVDEDGQVIPTCRPFYSWKTILASRIGVFRRAFGQQLFLETGASQPVAVDWGCGAAMFYRVAAFGGGPAFDEDFFLYFEDVDLCARLWRAGLSVVYYPDLLYRHQWQGQSRFRWLFFRYHVVSLGRFIWKYGGLPQRRDLFPGNAGVSGPQAGPGKEG